jgi:hypothetical protein
MELRETGYEHADLKDCLRIEFNCGILWFLDQLNNTQLSNKDTAPYNL